MERSVVDRLNFFPHQVMVLAPQVVFIEGASEATITVTVHPDLLPELNEVTVVELIDITQNGVPPGSDATRGAEFISGRTQSFLTVRANDAPHGVLVWSATQVPVEEVDGVDNVVHLTILREFGSIGAILITYRFALSHDSY